MRAGAEVRSINFTELLQSGVLHTKLWIVDGRHTYVGSANMDYRSLTQAPSHIHLLNLIFSIFVFCSFSFIIFYSLVPCDSLGWFLLVLKHT